MPQCVKLTKTKMRWNAQEEQERERERERERDTHTHTHTVTNTLTNNLKPGSERKKWLQNRSDCERAYYGSGDKSRTAARTVLLQLRCGTLLVRVVGESSLRNLFLRVRAKLFVFCAARVFFSVFFFRSRCQSERPGPWALHYWYLKNWHLNWVTSKLCHGVTTDFFLLFCDDFSPFWKRNSKKNNLSQIPCLKKNIATISYNMKGYFRFYTFIFLVSPYLAKYPPHEQHHEIENKNSGSHLSPSGVFFKSILWCLSHWLSSTRRFSHVWLLTSNESRFFY
jgi:hypothetical protein